MTLRVLDLFSGIGGFSLGLERAGMKTIAFCEVDPYCRSVLSKNWPGVPIYKDVRQLAKRIYDQEPENEEGRSHLFYPGHRVWGLRVHRSRPTH